MEVVYISAFDSNGIPEMLNKDQSDNDIKETIEQNFIDEVNGYFPERKRLHVTHPDWVKDNTINVLGNTTIKVTYIDEGAGYRNSFGYYIYDTDNKPEKVTDITRVYVIFPNASGTGKRGKLNPGDSMLLPYEVTTSTVGGLIIGKGTNYTFPVGKSIGFVIFANAWKDTHINKNAPRYFTDSTLNPERADWLKPHTALVKTRDNRLVMGLEDISREKSWCDHDFNDLLVLVSIDMTALSLANFSDPLTDQNGPTEYDVGYKKVFAVDGDGDTVECIAVLRIPLTSVVIKCGLSSKLRTDRVFVDTITGIKKTLSNYNISDKIESIGKNFNKAHSLYDATYIYTAGAYHTETLDRNDEVIGASGIHYFRTWNEARDFNFV